MIFLFTYGTLKKGFANNVLIKDLKYIGKATTCEKYQMYPCTNYAFPFVIKSKKNHYINGEVYKIKNNHYLSILDELEGVPTLYYRENINVLLENGKFIDSIMYFKNEDEYKDFIDYSNPIIEWTKEISSSEI